jgi:CRISPR system Cascade subunit CasC
MTDRFAQFHTLTSYAATLLNRDDVGFAKRMPFGGAVRTRISSQCLKRHWRLSTSEHALSQVADLSIRSRFTFQKYVIEPLIGEGIDPAVARAVTEALAGLVLGKKPEKDDSKKDGNDSKKAKKADPDGPFQTPQVTVLGRPEIDYLLDLAREICAKVADVTKVADVMKEHFDKDKRRNLAQLKYGAGLDAAMFGRMVTSDILARGDAAVHVAHAITTHAEHAETDYFSAVDDLLNGGDDAQLGSGSGHINTSELTSGLFYGYVVVDLPLLVSNIEGCRQADWQAADRTLAREVMRRLVHIVTMTSPGAKLGATAPYAYSQLVLVELGDAQPRSLANAFLRPVDGHPDLLENSYGALARHLADLDETYGNGLRRRHAALGPRQVLTEAVGQRTTLVELAEFAASPLDS